MPSYIELSEIPTRKVEAWKYTSLKGRFEPRMRLLNAAVDANVIRRHIAPLLQDWSHSIVVTCNGQLVPELSRLSAGLTVTTAGNPAVPKDIDVHTENGFLQTVAALGSPIQQMVFAERSTHAVLVVHVITADAGAEPGMVSCNAAVSVGKDADVRVLHRFTNLDGNTAQGPMVFGLTEHVAERAVYESVIVRDDKIAGAVFIRHDAVQAQSSKCLNHYVLTSGELTRFELKSQAEGGHTQTGLYGLYLLTGKEHGDFFTHLDHWDADQNSEQIFRGVLDGESQGVFRGKIHIHDGCPRTATGQLNQNILLSKKAEIDTLPQLQIDTDDVKATHGATVGQLQEEELFYLQSRAIDRETAKRMVLSGFALEMVQKIESLSLRQVVHRVVERKLSQPV
jgi:Fe-S cluster assembly protein SufD